MHAAHTVHAVDAVDAVRTSRARLQIPVLLVSTVGIIVGHVVIFILVARSRHLVTKPYRQLLSASHQQVIESSSSSSHQVVVTCPLHLDDASRASPSQLDDDIIAVRCLLNGSFMTA